MLDPSAVEGVESLNSLRPVGNRLETCPTMGRGNRLDTEFRLGRSNRLDTETDLMARTPLGMGRGSLLGARGLRHGLDFCVHGATVWVAGLGGAFGDDEPYLNSFIQGRRRTTPARLSIS